MTNVFDPTAFPALASVRDRTESRPNIERVYFPEGAYSQGADINEAFSREAGKRKAIGDLIAKDGNRLSGGDVIVNIAGSSVFISAGILYLLGAPRAVDARTLTAVPMTGDVYLGVRVTSVPVTAADDSLYLGLVSGTESYGEEGAVRTTLSLQWAFDTDGGAGDFYRYILLRDGEIVSQDAPPTLSGVQRQIQLYDGDAHGNYIVRGCQVSALGLNGSNRIFSIGAGVANILGIKVNRPTDNRFEVDPLPDLGTVSTEPQIYPASGVITTYHSPISAVSSAIITKEHTVSLSKGVTNSIDALPNTSVTSIVSVTQGATTYVANTDYKRTGDAVDWSLGGVEPSTGSTYSVTYQYLDTVTPVAITNTTVAFTGGVVGGAVFLSYTYKLPRYDRICMKTDGSFIYVRGIPSPSNPHAPDEPTDALSLCIVKNNWVTAPEISNDGTQALSFKELNRIRDRLVEAINLVAIERLKSSAIARAPGAALGVFTDPFIDATYRDAGVVQDLETVDGTLQLGMTVAYRNIQMGQVETLPYTEQTIIDQYLVTHCMKINPYQNFTPLPAKLTLTPAQDFWTEVQNLTSEVTRIFGTGNTQRTTQQRTLTRLADEPIRTMRQISVAYSISGFGAGENLTGLTFDGISVLTPGITANGAGVISGSFNIPANVSTGVKLVTATGQGGSYATAVFQSVGVIERLLLTTSTSIQRFQVTQNNGGGGGGNPGAMRTVDPQSQTFVFEQGRHISSVALRFCAIGNTSKKVTVELCLANAQSEPTSDVLQSVDVNMAAVVANNWTNVRLPWPLYVPPGQFIAMVVKTDDPNHSISAARVGAYDALHQQYVTSQPYINGDRFDGSNGLAWLLDPTSDLTFQVKAALFTATSRTIEIDTFAVNNVSDFKVLANVQLPEASCSVIFELVIGLNTYRVSPGQTLELTDYYTGNVTLKAILTGTTTASPILSQDIVVALGTLKTTGIYVGRLFDMGNPVNMEAVLSTFLPVGSALTVAFDQGTGTFGNATLYTSTPIDQGFIERVYRKDTHSAANGGRIKLTLTGTPAARPSLADLRAYRR